MLCGARQVVDLPALLMLRAAQCARSRHPTARRLRPARSPIFSEPRPLSTWRNLVDGVLEERMRTAVGRAAGRVA